MPSATTRFRRNTEDVSTALGVLMEKNVEAIAFVGTYRPFAELVNSANSYNFSPIFTTVSFVSSKDLFPLIEQPSKILVTEVLPDPMDCQLLYCQQFRRDMADAGFKDVDRIQLEGYLNAMLFTLVAKHCKEDMSAACFFNEIQQLSLSENDLTIEFSADDHQGLDQIYLNFYQ